MGRASKQSQDVARAKENLETYQEKLEELEQQLEAETENIRDRFDPLTEELEVFQLKPRKSDIDIRLVALAWTPFLQDAEGNVEQEY